MKYIHNEGVLKQTKKASLAFIALAFVAASSIAIVGFSEAKKPDYNTIQSGSIVASDGSVVEVGYDQWGYNYQAHMFKGGYCDSYRDAAWCQPVKDVTLLMKWNDAWISNVDKDGDFKLDRHYGFTSYIGSGAWLTNHQSGTYVDVDGKTQKWNYFTKIVAAPADATLTDGVWYTANGKEIGPVIWGQFATVQSVYNDTGSGEHGIEYLSPNGPGFGKF